jgi:putative FMN-dependent luciferase-like monooxygenase
MTSTSKRLGFFTRILDDAPAATRYQNAIEQIQLADRLGFDSAWVAQHHFHRDEGGLPSPLVFLSYAAAVTTRIRLGTGIITLPLENAIRVAEDTAVLDHLSGGRLEVGVGSGGTPSSFTGFGLEVADRARVSVEHLDVILSAWAGQPIGDPTNALYPPAPTLADRVWQATFSVDGARRAGLAGDGLMLSRTQPRTADAPFASLSDIQNPIIDAYLDALPSGATPRIVGSRTLFVADDRTHALELASAGLRRASAIAMFAKAPGRPVSVTDDLNELITRLDVHVGTADDVIESLSLDTALARTTDITFQVHSVDPPHQDVLRSIELLAGDVAPQLGWVNTALTSAS